MRKRFLCMFISLAMVLGLFPPPWRILPPRQPAQSLSAVYVPMDDRPFNDSRVQALAESLNISLIMPPAEYYANRLDGQVENEDGSIYRAGDREALLQWLQSAEVQGQSTFILSLDQLFSGGLMNSRCLSQRDLELENQIMDTLCDLAQQGRPSISSTRSCV